MKKGIKYFVGIILIMGGLGALLQKQLLSFLFLTLLGLIIIPPVSGKLKQQYPIWEKKLVRYIAYFVLFALFGTFNEPVSDSHLSSKKSPQQIVINYIKNDPQDIHMKNIAYLVEVGNIFNNYNFSMMYPEQSNRVYEQKDTGVGITRIMFRPEIDFKKAKEYLNPDKEYGYVKDYQIIFEIDSKGNIFNMKSAIKYDDTPFVGYSNNDVPDIRDYINTEIVDARLAEKKQQDKAYEEKEQMNKVMGNDDFWNLYDPMVKTRIYKLIVEKDCNKLQVEFNTADDMRNRKHKSGISASKEVDLMDFIDGQMRELNCY